MFSSFLRPILLLSFMLFSYLSVAQPTQKITLEDIWLKGTYQQQYLHGINWMKNSRFYTAQQMNYANRSIDIVKFDVATGKAIEKLLSGTDLLTQEGDMVLAEEYHLSPDERSALIATDVEPIYRRSSKATWYLYDFQTKKLRNISQQQLMHVTFSPDGNKLAYVKENDLYIYDIATDEERQITKDGAKNQVINGSADWVYEEEFEFTQAFHWSPDSKKIAYYRFDESQVKEYNMQVWNDLYPTDERFKYPKAGEANSVVTIHIYDLPNGNTIQAETGAEQDQYIPRIKWTTNSDLLSVQRLNRLQNQFELLHVSASTGAAKLIYEEQNDTYVEINDVLTYLNNGKEFIISSERDGYRHLYLYDMQGKLIRQLTKGKWEVSEFAGLDEKERLVYFTAHEESALRNHFYSVPLKGGKTSRVTSAKGDHQIMLSPDARYFIDFNSTTDRPVEITVGSLPNGKTINTLVDNKALKNKLEPLKLAPVEFFTFTTTQQVKLNAWMIKPKDFDPQKQYPVLLTIYGGPGHQTVTDSWSGANGMWYQMLADMGYIVMSVDNRGTGGRGADFKKVTQHNLGKYETEDMIETAKYLSTLDYVDQDRIGIFGWSFGGYLSSLAITVGADFFKMAIAVAPVTTWRFYDTIYTERYLGLPDENPSGYDDNSPLSHASKLKGKYLLVHGTADDNVHLQNAMAMQEALIMAGKKFDVFYYPNKNHGIYGGNTRHHLFTMLTDYIVNNL